ncbi:MAG: hypothetical protein K9M57_01260 [Phycisphaerae bacterium]|nr:hypothetical protein [Phycisphaerae bacterium]
MVQQVTNTSRSWKAALAITIAAGAFVWHMLACTESPMAFSPDGKNLAFVTMEPYDVDDGLIAGKNLFRLMVLKDQKDFQVIEQTKDYMLSAPCYSSDGAYIAYLKVPLLTEDNRKQFEQMGKYETELKRIEKESQEALKGLYQSDPPKEKAPDTNLMALPDIESNFELYKHYILAPPELPAKLIVRDTKTDKVISQTGVNMALSDNVMMAYLTCQPVFSPDSQWVYVPAGRMVYGVNIKTKEQRIVAGPVGAGKFGVTPMALSPDGKRLAVLTGDKDPVLVLVNTDGRRTIYQRLEEAPSLSGMVWIDSQTLALLVPKKTENGKFMSQLAFCNTNGELIRTLDLQLPPLDDENKATGELALSPDGKSMVIAFMKNIFFMTAKGKVLKHIEQEEKNILVQSVFTPDSSQVAFKRITEIKADHPTVTAIEFYTPDGKAVSTKNLPAVNP